jgi:hypothetical protein
MVENFGDQDFEDEPLNEDYEDELEGQ